MTIHDRIGARQSESLDVARRLAVLGVPVFVAYRDESKPGGFGLPPGWQDTAANPAYVEAWEPGRALCAVGGLVFDVIDVDPRHGGDGAMRELLAELGEGRPRVYGRTRTPSGGWHLWVAPLGVGSPVGFLPGLDLRGGRADGKGRGFVFIPPTVRTSKADGQAREYAWHTLPLAAPVLDNSGAKLAALISALVAARQPVRATTARPAGTPQGRMIGILDRLGSAQEGERNSLLYWAACKTGEVVADGALGQADAAELLADAAGRIGLPADEAANTINSGLRTGLAA